MREDIEVSILRALASSRLASTEVANLYNVKLADVLRIEADNAKDLATWRHCDSYLDDPSAPSCLRRFLEFHRRPTTWPQMEPKPHLFATLRSLQGGRFYGFLSAELGATSWIGRRVQVVGANGLGCVHITNDLVITSAYRMIVSVGDLDDFSDTSGVTIFGRPLKRIF